jgi:hypothetical protein
MGFYDPQTKQWYTDQSMVPADTPVYDSTAKQWVTISTAMQPGRDVVGGEGTIEHYPGSLGYIQTPVQAPAGAPANIIPPIDPTSGDAHSIAAQLLRQQFEEWKTAFKPIELQAMQQLSFNNPEVLPTALAKARTAATGASEAMGGILERQTRAMGVKETPEQAQTTKRVLNLSRAAAIAGAENVARENVAAQDQQILLGTTPNYRILKGELNQ